MRGTELGVPFLSSSGLRNEILQGDAWELSKLLPAESFDLIVTSPPYFGHRKYADAGDWGVAEFGREERVEDYVAKLVSLFSELRRCVKDSGTLWLNLGDTYRDNRLLGVPWRVALALQDNGWILRSDVIWSKPNAMPSSVKSRPTMAHEYLFLLSKSPNYQYFADAIREPHVTFSPESKMRGGRNHFGKKGGTPEQGKNSGNPNLHTGRWDQAFHPLGRTKRTVWSISLGKFREAHFAVFPEKLVETCILASTQAGDFVLDPFMGSGTTAVVSKKLGRDYLGLELLPKYVDMARDRAIATQTQEQLPLFMG